MSKITEKVFDVIDENINFHSHQNNLSIIKMLTNLKNNIIACDIEVEKLQTIASNYDFDVKTPVNGIRSFIDVFQSAISNIKDECFELQKLRFNYIFRSTNRVSR